jgi:arylsulfatase A-like enzyme
VTWASRLLAPCIALSGCSCGRGHDALPPSAAPPLAADVADAAASAARGVVFDWTRAVGQCAFGHRGVLLDFGDPSMTADLRTSPAAHAARDEVVEHEGATWLRARARTVSTGFYWPSVASEGAEGPVYVEARVRGILAHAVAVAIDGKPAGSLALTRGETRIAVARGASPIALAPGGHELALHFTGGPRASDEALAEVDWVHVGTGESTEPYAAPTREDVVIDATLGGQSIRALALRAPGFVRCSGWIPANATLEASLATAGGGDADVEARLVRDRHPPVVLGTATIAGGGKTWVPWSVPVTGVDGDGALASIELVVRRAAKGTRVWLGAPRVVAAGPLAAPAPSTARGVVLVVLGSTPARALAPWGGAHTAPELSAIASAGTTFLANRASSSLANAVVASMLTGLTPLSHGLDDPDARLPDDVIMVQEACRQGGVATAMFTANPTTGAAFGFARGWDTFVEHDPLEDVPATRVFDDAAAWIDAHKAGRFFVVVHARGGHPPWDASPEDLRAMPPEGYFGMIEPRRAAEAMAKARKHPGRFKEEDRVRAWALFDRAVDDHDAALGRLMAGLRASGREADAAVVVTGDVGPSEAPPVPFGDAETLDEALLATPLVARLPAAGAPQGRRIAAPTAPADVARTVLDALGLAPPSAFEGEDLAALAQGALVPAERPLAATHGGRYSVRWGPYVLLGSRGRELRMCDLSLDPSCVADVRGTSPLALEPLRRWTFETLAPRPTRAARTPAVLDEHAAAALVRWGREGDHEPDDDF